jgi:hypothetical protein
LRFSTNTVVLDANTITHLIQQLWGCILILHKKVVINNIALLESTLTNYQGGIIHR